MSMSIQAFIAHVGAEITADKIIVGELAERRVIGDMVPVVTLTEEGRTMLEQAEAETQESKPRAPRHMQRKPVDPVAPEAPAADAGEAPAA